MIQNLLIIEDDVIAIKNYAELFKDLPIHIVFVSDGNDAMSTFHSHSFDLVILDLGLPNVNGKEILIEIRKASKTPVFIISGANSETIEECLSLGADKFIEKPVNPFELKSLISSYK